MDLSIREDYDHDFENDDLGMGSDLAEIEQLEAQLHQLIDSSVAIERFGINPPAFAALKSQNLLASSALEAMSPSDFGFESSDSAVTQAALEDLIATINDTAGRWSAKVVAFATGLAGKVGALLAPIQTKLSAVARKAMTAIGDAAGVVKAHPYATIAALVTAAVAVVSIVAYVTGGIPFQVPGLATLTGFVAKVDAMIAKIKLPFGKIVTTITQQGTKLSVSIVKTAEVLQTKSLQALGWSRSAISAILGKLSGVSTGIKSGFSAFTTKIVSAVKRIDSLGGDMGAHLQNKVKEKTGSGILSWGTKKTIEKLYDTMLWSLVMSVLGLVKGVAVKAFAATAQTFHAVSNAESPEPTAA